MLNACLFRPENALDCHCVIIYSSQIFILDVVPCYIAVDILKERRFICYSLKCYICVLLALKRALCYVYKPFFRDCVYTLPSEVCY